MNDRSDMIFVCKRCEYEAHIEGHIVAVGTPPHGDKLLCGRCDGFIRWLPKPKNEGQRTDQNGKHRRDWLDRHDGDLICAMCSARQSEKPCCDYHIDHIHGLEDGGPDVFTNTMPLCRTCHVIKNQLRTLWRHASGESSRT